MSELGTLKKFCWEKLIVMPENPAIKAINTKRFMSIMVVKYYKLLQNYHLDRFEHQ